MCSRSLVAHRVVLLSAASRQRSRKSGHQPGGGRRDRALDARSRLLNAIAPAAADPRAAAETDRPLALAPRCSSPECAASLAPPCCSVPPMRCFGAVGQATGAGVSSSSGQPPQRPSPCASHRCVISPPRTARLPERTQIAPVDSAEAWRGTEGRATLPPLTSAQSPVARADDDSHTVLSATRAASAQSARALSDDTQKGDAERPAGSLSRCRLFRPRHHHDDPPGAGNFGGALVCAWGRQGPVRRFRRFQVA